MEKWQRYCKSLPTVTGVGDQGSANSAEKDTKHTQRL
jgi:hypothetical protein